MKEFFKYGNGYVNINDEYLFLTNSGNWSEIKSIVEKSPKSIKSNRLKRYKYNLFYLIIFFLMFYLNVKKKAFNFRASFVLVILGVAAYFYMKRETGNKYKIPIAKITAIRITNSAVKISFINAANAEDCEYISNVEEKGLKILSKLLPQSI